MIRLEPEAHVYSDDTTGRIYTSVSEVIRSVYPQKSWDGVNPAVIANARDRGMRVETIFNDYITTGHTFYDETDRADVADYVERLIAWWDDATYLEAAAVQKIVSDEENGIAGTIDIVCEFDFTSPVIIDLKCVSQLQKSYKLQLGAYLDMSGYSTAALLHVTKKKVALVHYDAEECMGLWLAAKEWWLAKQRLGVA